MPLILGTNSIKDTGYDVDNSLRFNDGSSDYLSKTQVTATSRRKFTLSTWLKRGNITGTFQFFVSSYISSSDRLGFYFNSDDGLAVFSTDGSTTLFRHTNAKFRDTSAWYHVVYRIDTTHANASDRARMYVNGEQITSFNSPVDPTQNDDLQLGTSSYNLYIGGYDTSQYFFDGYMAETVMIDGQSLDPTSFGEFDEDTGIWKPIDVSGLTFGTNGFYLDFENSGSLGADVSGNGNNFTVNNLTSIDQTTDTPTNNFATLNPLDGHIAHVVFSEGNLKSDFGATASKKSFVRSTIGVASGKWYFEAKVIQNANFFSAGISDRPSPTDTTELGFGAYDYAYVNDGGTNSKLNNGTYSSYGDSFTTNDIIGVAVDLDNLKIYFSKNGTFQNSGDPTNGTNPAFTITAPSSTDHGFYFFCVGDMTAANNVIWSANFGSPPFTISSGNSDGNGYGNFEYAVPSGYYALNTKNLAEYG